MAYILLIQLLALLLSTVLCIFTVAVFDNYLLTICQLCAKPCASTAIQSKETRVPGPRGLTVQKEKQTTTVQCAKCCDSGGHTVFLNDKLQGRLGRGVTPRPHSFRDRIPEHRAPRGGNHSPLGSHLSTIGGCSPA